MPLDQQRQDRLKRHAVKRIVRVVVHSAKNLAIQQASIHRHCRIDIDRPQVNSTCEASDIVESCLTQNFGDFQTPHSLMTVDDNRSSFVFSQRIDMLRKRLHRDMNRTCDLCAIFQSQFICTVIMESIEVLELLGRLQFRSGG